MILTNQAVRHKVFGSGQIEDLEDAYLVVAFACGEKRFVFPDAFGQFLEFEDADAQAQVEQMLESQRQARDMRAQELIGLAHQAREAEKAQDDELLEAAEQALYASDEQDESEYSAIFDLRPFQLRTQRS